MWLRSVILARSSGFPLALAMTAACSAVQYREAPITGTPAYEVIFGIVETLHRPFSGSSREDRKDEGASQYATMPDDDLAFAPLTSGYLRLSTIVDLPKIESLTVVRDLGSLSVRLPKRLEGLVKIATEEEALSYLRLFSNPRFYYSDISEYVIEIRALEDVDASWFMGDSKSFEIARKAPEGFMGLASSSTLSAMGIRGPEISRVNGAFVVQRTCIHRDSKITGRIFVVKRRERVSADGRYQLLSEVSIPNHAKAVDWDAPVRGY